MNRPRRERRRIDYMKMSSYGLSDDEVPNEGGCGDNYQDGEAERPFRETVVE